MIEYERILVAPLAEALTASSFAKAITKSALRWYKMHLDILSVNTHFEQR
jgi:hypothetical protein